jgi:hypothetical protein
LALKRNQEAYEISLFWFGTSLAVKKHFYRSRLEKTASSAHSSIFMGIVFQLRTEVHQAHSEQQTAERASFTLACFQEILNFHPLRSEHRSQK